MMTTCTQPPIQAKANESGILPNPFSEYGSKVTHSEYSLRVDVDAAREKAREKTTWHRSPLLLVLRLTTLFP